MARMPRLHDVRAHVTGYLWAAIRNAVPRKGTVETDDAADRFDGPPTIEDLEMAGATWQPLDDDEDGGLEIARDNGYVALRDPSAPDRPVHIIAESEWEALAEGDEFPDDADRPEAGDWAD
jgi:hypothetical protein